MRIKNILIPGMAIAFVAPLCMAEEPEWSGFLSDYSKLEKVDDRTADYRYLAEGVFDRVGKYDAVMLDQPEIFIAADSPYKGAKPKHLDALADALRTGMASALSEDFYIVDRPGPNVMYVSVALSDLNLTKKKKSILGYTPIGLVGGAVVSAANTDIAKKAKLQDVVIEVEVMDSETGEVLVAAIDHRGEGREEPSSWEELEQTFYLYGLLAHCRLSNPRLPEESRADCFADHLKRMDEWEQANRD